LKLEEALLEISSMQALEAMVRLEGSNQLRDGVINLSYEVANDYLIEYCSVDRRELRTVISVCLAPVGSSWKQ
jgi:hypothetical protein